MGHGETEIGRKKKLTFRVRLYYSSTFWIREQKTEDRQVISWKKTPKHCLTPFFLVILSISLSSLAPFVGYRFNNLATGELQSPETSLDVKSLALWEWRILFVCRFICSTDLFCYLFLLHLNYVSCLSYHQVQRWLQIWARVLDIIFFPFFDRRIGFYSGTPQRATKREKNVTIRNLLQYQKNKICLVLEVFFKNLIYRIGNISYRLWVSVQSFPHRFGFIHAHEII